MTRLTRSRQGGMALIVALIMLVMMTLVAVVAFNVGKTSLQVVGNMQTESLTTDAANSAIQEVLSTTRLFQAPTNIFLVPCSAANTRCYDINRDGTNDVTVTITPAPQCIKSQTIRNQDLNFNDAEDRSCATGTVQLFGVEGVATGNSICADSLWDVSAVATDAITQASTTVTVGAAVRVAQDDVGTSCVTPAPPPPPP